MTDILLDRWLNKLGYADEASSLHTNADTVDQTHPYAVEIKALLDTDGVIKARAVFDVDGVPTVVFVGGKGCFSGPVDCVCFRPVHETVQGRTDG